MESLVKLIVIMGLGYLLMTCSTMHNTISTKSRITDRSHSLMDQRPSVRFTQLKRVGLAINATGQPTAYMLLRSESGELLDLYWVRSAIKIGNSSQSYSLDPTQIELRAHWNGQHFFQSDSEPTLVTVSIDFLTPTEAIINVTGKLVHSATGAYLEIAPSRIIVRGEYLNVLFAES